MEEKRTCRGGSCDHLKGVTCNVEHCYYNDCDTHCTAHQISVGPCNASCSENTLCATFKPKED